MADSRLQLAHSFQRFLKQSPPAPAPDASAHVYAAEGAIHFIHRTLQRIMRAAFDSPVFVPIPSDCDRRLFLRCGSEQLLYWQEGAVVYCSAFDGSNKRAVVSGLTNESHPGIDTANNLLLWANWKTREVFRARLDGSELTPLPTDIIVAGDVGSQPFVFERVDEIDVLGTFRLPVTNI